MDFIGEIARLSADMQEACGVSCVWKDADPAWRMLLPRRLSEHRNPHCVAIKANAEKLIRCIATDDLSAADWPAGAEARIRTCPFGVTEVLVPVWGVGGYQGCLFIGPWYRHQSGDGLVKFPGARRTMAMARLAHAGFAEICDRRHAALAAARARQVGDERMAAAVAWIDAHLDAGLGVRRAALAAGLSPSRFVHRFKSATGTAFGVHVRKRLMHEAARLLADPHIRIADVSATLGFANQNWFATSFRRHHGITPTQWRQRLPTA